LQIILASTSQTRQAIMHNAGIEFTSQDSKLDEAHVKQSLPSSTPKQIAERLAIEKAHLVSRLYPKALVIGTDQTLGLNKIIFDKPKTIVETREQLVSLRNKTHQLYSAITCIKDSEIKWFHCGEANLTMRNFSDEFLEHYLKTIAHSYAQSVGGYQLEASGINLFEKIQGDYFTILGLPILPLLDFLRQEHMIPS
jgi:septum formation protein